MVMYYNTLNKNNFVFPHSYSKEREKGNRGSSCPEKEIANKEEEMTQLEN